MNETITVNKVEFTKSGNKKMTTDKGTFFVNQKDFGKVG